MSLTQAEASRLSRRLGVSHDDIFQYGFQGGDLRDIYNRARKNMTRRIQIGVMCLCSAFALSTGAADHLDELVEHPQIARGIEIMKSSPDTEAVGQLYEDVLTSPKTPFYAKIASGTQGAIALGFLPFNLRRRRRLSSELTDSKTALESAPQNAI